MVWPATLIGAAAGFALANIPGAMLGGLLGHVLDRRLHLDSWGALRARMRGDPAIDQQDLLFILLGRLAKSDGRVQEAHIQQARSEMKRIGLDEAGTRRAIAAFSRGKSGGDNLHPALHKLKGERVTVERLLRSCWQMAAADGRIGQRERALILQWGSWLGLAAHQVEALGAGYDTPQGLPPKRGNSYRDALSLLGVTADCEPAVIKRAYRRLLSQNHPDKLAGSGASPAVVRAATDRTRELHSAYNLIRERHGFR
ncbi:TerB family tellurite resistance protein [Pseudomonas sp. JS3066]|uniref:TerB family tellurite resistance protein n=1 Tax=unclassified Pseudomonas TaxID=196821 RepID=UPI000EAA3B5F|nr:MULTISPECIES: TerB family tellurite resistance protein [unclassified Pseudomonas]AYF88795.1 molecular chaperone DjlA [Pseudomonas sp. DY-1]MDH4653492.1 molecular chaperone DjlA [Pseudomonas sp. BN606]MRK22414.1 molecular chaperone DjlA [Pseudomonas sp. JG-B]WVK93663.1 TerB family tellurite resistance protein [Pseudomonas sp. JS3066]